MKSLDEVIAEALADLAEMKETVKSNDALLASAKEKMDALMADASADR